jgi:hypothetical protein
MEYITMDIGPPALPAKEAKMAAHEFFPRSDAFQQVIFTPVGTIDVIATDRAARRHNSELAADGAAKAASALRRGLARGLRTAAAWLDAAPTQRLTSPRA